MIVIVDSDGLIGSLNPEDKHYSTSIKILTKLAKENSKLIYPATTVVETVTFLQGRLNQPKLAEQFLKQVNKDQFIIEIIDDVILKKATAFMNLRASKHHTLFDAIVAAIAKKHKADAIFSFDHFYKTKGFKLAGELK